MRREHSWPLAEDLGALIGTHATRASRAGYTLDEFDAELAAQLGARLRAVEARRAQRRAEQAERDLAAARPAPAPSPTAARRFAREPEPTAEPGPEPLVVDAEAMVLALDLERTLDGEPPPSWFVRVFCDDAQTRSLVKLEVYLLLAAADAADPRAIVDAVNAATGPEWRAHVDIGAGRRVDVKLWRPR